MFQISHRPLWAGGWPNLSTAHALVVARTTLEAAVPHQAALALDDNVECTKSAAAPCGRVGARNGTAPKCSVSAIRHNDEKDYTLSFDNENE